MLAIGRGKAEQVERLVRLGLQCSASIKALLMMYDSAVKKIYRPCIYSEEDDM